MGHTVVCISSHDGAAGQEVAQLVASSMGFRIIDEEIVTRAAAEAGVDHGVVTDIERRKSRLLKLIEGMGSPGVAAAYMGAHPELVGHGEPASDELRGMIRSAIEDTAASGSVVIVSHAASMALTNRKDVLRVLVTAPAKTRERRLAATLGVDDKEAARAVKRGDAARADYIKRFYSIGAEMPTHYDLVINTDRIAAEPAAQLIVQAAGGSANVSTAGT